MTTTRVLALVGSIRAASMSRRLAEAAATAAPTDTEVHIYEGLADVPFYNEDIDVPGSIESVDKLRAAVADADALLLVTPEYNGSTPAVLKNAIDWLSRPYGVGAISGKPTAVISASPSGNGAKWSQADTAKAAGVAGGSMLDDAHLSIASTTDKFGDKHPSENPEVSSQIAAVVADLVSAARTSAAA